MQSSHVSMCTAEEYSTFLFLGPMVFRDRGKRTGFAEFSPVKWMGVFAIFFMQTTICRAHVEMHRYC